MLVFRIECSRCILEQRAVKVLERVDVDDGIHFPINLARNEGNYTSPRAIVELGRLGAKRIARNTPPIAHDHAKRASGARSPHASVLGAEGAGAGPRRDPGWLEFPQQLERDIYAVAAASDEQECFLCVCCRRLTIKLTGAPPPAPAKHETRAGASG